MKTYRSASGAAVLVLVGALAACGESVAPVGTRASGPGGECPPDPAPTTYCNVAIEMSDGVTIRANLTLPSAVEGCRFPTIVEITGYNKGAGDYNNGCGDVKAGDVARGYAAMIIDDRGTGASEGIWDRYGPRTRLDYAEILDWIQAQPWSNGRVGTTGTSYGAGTAIMLAVEDGKRVKAGKPQAVHAVWGNLMMSDMYRDYPHVGGFANNGFTVPWLGLVVGLSSPPPSTLGSDEDAFDTWFDHNTSRQILVDLAVAPLAGADGAYDNEFYRTHSPGFGSEHIIAPVAWTGGWFDIFQRGEAEWWFKKLPNAAQKKMWMNPVYHTGGDNYFADQNIGSQGEVLQRWWDRHLKGVANDIDALPNVNLLVMGVNRWFNGPDWPTPRYTRFYFTEGESGSAQSQHDGVLARTVPAEIGADTIPFTTAAGLCSRTTIQWSGGFVGGITGDGHPCQFDNRPDEQLALTYTTEPLAEDLTIAGRMSADLWIRSTRPDTALVVKLLDVAPNGASTQVGSGHLIARHRAIDEAQTVMGPDGMVIQPYHPFTREAEAPLVTNVPTRMLVELFATANTFLAGHRIRVAITTSDNPVFSIPAPWLEEMNGGEVTVLRSAVYPSHLVLPIVSTIGAPPAQ